MTIFFLGSDVHQTWIPNALGLVGVGWSLVSSSGSTGLAPGRNKSRLAPVSGQVGTELRIPSGQFRWSRSETAKPRRCRPDTTHSPPPPTSLLTRFRCFHLAGGGLWLPSPESLVASVRDVAGNARSSGGPPGSDSRSEKCALGRALLPLSSRPVQAARSWQARAQITARAPGPLLSSPPQRETPDLVYL